MLATRSSTVPTGPGWVHEVKWDGMRVLVTVAGGAVRLTSRNENDVSVSFPELAGLGSPAELGGLGHDAVLDGEVVALSDGVPRFGALADRMHVANPRRAQELSRSNPVTLVVFDVLSLDGVDMTTRPLAERRRVLAGLPLAGPHWQLSPQYDDGPALQRATVQQGMEGIVSKRLSSPYQPGRRSPDWLKLPNRPSGSYVVGGWRPEVDSTTRLGAVLVGTPSGTGLAYQGRVGSGIAGKAGQRLKALLDPLRAEASPFGGEVPAVDAKGTVWVRPEVVVDVASLGFTPQGRLRQPAYLGVRTDLTPADVADLADG
jgi:bifunctional non-homologous end joining protein LigD